VQVDPALWHCAPSAALPADLAPFCAPPQYGSKCVPGSSGRIHSLPKAKALSGASQVSRKSLAIWRWALSPSLNDARLKPPPIPSVILVSRRQVRGTSGSMAGRKMNKLAASIAKMESIVPPSYHSYGYSFLFNTMVSGDWIVCIFDKGPSELL
jgi:hypothetical protein